MDPVRIETAVFIQWVADDGYEIGMAEKSDLANFMGPNKEAYAANGGKVIGYRGHGQSQTIDLIDERPQLFTEFANIKNDDEIIAFANQYGLLLPKERIVVPAGLRHADEECTLGERVNFWKEQIRDMRLALQFWQWGKFNMTETLYQHISKQNDYIRYEYRMSDPEIEGYLKLRENATEGSGVTFKHLAEGGVVLQAKFFAQHVINEHIKKFPVGAHLVFDKKGDLKQYNRPSSLLALLWFQFLRYTTGQQDIQQCPVCSGWYDVSDEGGEVRWTERCPRCANRLRVKKSKVKKQYLNEVPVEKIISMAKKTDPNTIREWIAEFEKEKGGSQK